MATFSTWNRYVPPFVESTERIFVYPIRPGIVDATVRFAQAAKEAGVEIIVNMSQKSAREDSQSHAALAHWLSERVFDWSGLPVSHIRPTLFSEWMLYGAAMIRQGTWLVPFGTGRHAPIAGEDQARVIVGILENPKAHAGNTYPLVGPVERTVREGCGVPIGESRFFHRSSRRSQGSGTARGAGPLAGLCASPFVHASREHREDSRPHARHRQRVRAGLRHALRQPAKGLFGNPEVGVGLVPGGGALEWLPRLVGRSRALEIVLSGDDFDADIAERYGWVNRTLDDNDLDSFVDTLVRRLASFDRETLAAAKSQVNRFGTPTAAELKSSNDLFFPLLALPSAQARRAKIRGIGYGVASDFELNFGRYLPTFGRADDDDINKDRAKAS